MMIATGAARSHEYLQREACFISPSSLPEGASRLHFFISTRDETLLRDSKERAPSGNVKGSIGTPVYPWKRQRGERGRYGVKTHASL